MADGIPLGSGPEKEPAQEREENLAAALALFTKNLSAAWSKKVKFALAIWKMAEYNKTVNSGGPLPLPVTDVTAAFPAVTNA